MTILSTVAQAFSSNTLRLFRPIAGALAACTVSLGLVAAVQAAPVTGIPVGNGASFGWTPNSTNALNYQSLVPGREGQSSPYVIFNSLALGSVTLDFYNLAPGGAFFEIRTDGIPTGVTPHPVVNDGIIVLQDTIHSGGNSVASGTSELGLTYSATSYVDVRLALGGERDWDFDWVRFEVPLPGTIALFSIGLICMITGRRRRSS